MKSLGMIFAGFGGQGVLFSGKITAYAGMLDGREVSWLPSYGPEMRGGTANCSVCLSDSQIGSPLVVTPDVLVAMNTPSYDKFIASVAKGGTVITDSSIVKAANIRDDLRLFEIPATQLSKDEGLDGIANMILLGKMLKETQFAALDTLQKAVEKCVPASKQHLLEHNIRAVKLGMSL